MRTSVTQLGFMERVKKLFGVLALAAAMPPSALAATTLQDYLAQVRMKHEGYRGAIESGLGLRQRAEESSLAFSPAFFANAQFAEDKAPKMNPSFQGTQSYLDTYSVGFSKQTSFGLAAKLHYDWALTQVSNATLLEYSTTGGPGPGARFFDVGPTLEISQPLWRNGFGAETRAAVEAGREEALAKSLGQKFSAKKIMATAEGAYWRLAAAREALAITRVSVDRSQKIRDWSAGRVRLRLADESDLLQSEAGLQARQLDLKNAQNEDRAASLAFNAQLGVDSDKVTDELAGMGTIDIDTLAPPRRTPLREDVEAAMHEDKAAQAASKIGVEKSLPTLEVYASAKLNGHNSELSPAMSDSLSATYPTAAVGLKFQVPLDFGTLSDDRNGYRREAAASALNYDRKVFEQERDWTDLVTRFSEAKERLLLAKQIEDVQKRKYAREKERHGGGRTTTYFVLQFEQDYAAAQLVRLRYQSEILGLVAQMKTFEGTQQ